MQNVLSLAKVVGLALVIFSGITAFWDGSANSTLSNISVSAIGDTPGAIGLALVIVLYTFGGWNDAAFVAAEVRNPRKGISRSLIIGTAVITFVYLVVNLSYLSGLGFERAKFSTAIAADLLRLRFGEVGAALMSILVMVAALGAVNGLILTGSRVCAALGEDHRVFSRLGQWHPRTGAPIWAIAAQGFVSVALILLVGTDAGRTFIGWGIHSLGIPSPTNWEGRGGFDTLLKSTAPVFWLFFLLTGLSLFILRRRDPDVERPFRVPFYPITPIIFCLTSAYMLYRSVIYAGGLTLVGLLLLAIGLPLFWFSRRTPSIVPKFEPA
jgi:amino acid transporter